MTVAVGHQRVGVAVERLAEVSLVTTRLDCACTLRVSNKPTPQSTTVSVFHQSPSSYTRPYSFIFLIMSLSHGNPYYTPHSVNLFHRTFITASPSILLRNTNSRTSQNLSTTTFTFFKSYQLNFQSNLSSTNYQKHVAVYSHTSMDNKNICHTNCV